MPAIEIMIASTACSACPLGLVTGGGGKQAGGLLEKPAHRRCYSLCSSAATACTPAMASTCTRQCTTWVRRCWVSVCNSRVGPAKLVGCVVQGMPAGLRVVCSLFSAIPYSFTDAEWLCPVCRGICNCEACRMRNGLNGLYANLENVQRAGKLAAVCSSVSAADVCLTCGGA